MREGWKLLRLVFNLHCRTTQCFPRSRGGITRIKIIFYSGIAGCILRCVGKTTLSAQRSPKEKFAKIYILLFFDSFHQPPHPRSTRLTGNLNNSSYEINFLRFIDRNTDGQVFVRNCEAIRRLWGIEASVNNVSHEHLVTTIVDLKFVIYR